MYNYYILFYFELNNNLRVPHNIVVETFKVLQNVESFAIQTDNNHLSLYLFE